jgi:hypothetical protein
MKHVSKVGALTFAVSVVASAGALACASNPPLPTEGSTSGIRAAEEVGAADVPRASLHLQLAKEELERAKVMSENGDDAQAESMLLRAEADAELAVALSREEAEIAESQQAFERVRELRREHTDTLQRNNRSISSDKDSQ